MNRKTGGLLALLGLAGGAFAYWKYKNMSEEEKAVLKTKVKNTGKKIKETASEVEKSITETFSDLKKKAKSDSSNMSPR